MRGAALLIGAILLSGCGSLASNPGADFSDAPESRARPALAIPRHASYAEALAAWRGPEDVNAWIGAEFQYDMDRAVALSETARAGQPATPIIEPAAFYARPEGVCVDLARFAVETLRRVAPELRVRYLMIEFEPASVRGQVLRRHWVAVYENADGIRVVADSKRPGIIAGPYQTLQQFAEEYARLRGRQIVHYRELDSYQRKMKSAASRQVRERLE
ncbi:hypothetical protein [Ramlibacter tataouinensis]|uniref:Transglutaminase-like domain-containing protein n=1 Tax=Ramlibacter tataouinensis TaxID=94132 RepID=A0A127JW65_9BURK|nr:hypothetical protein [Ramlibacter tataouinensis]AMO24145.1 hypothetical protein UC35_16475 [Ramlibacter tataouinensis]